MCERAQAGAGVRRGFGLLPCPLCGADATVALQLDDCCTFYCTDCEGDFSPATVEAFVARWRPVLAWVAQAPAIEE